MAPQGMRKRMVRRAGAVLVAVLVALMVVGMIGASLVRTGGARRALAVGQERKLQAGWLAESGLERAAARLAVDAGYRGETWTIPAADLGGPDGAAVTIAVEAGEGGRFRVEARADFPPEPHRRARQTRRATIDRRGAEGAGEGP